MGGGMDQTLMLVGPAAAAAATWVPALQHVLAGGGLRMALQPVIDLRRGQVVGYEALARFEGPPAVGPDVWFDAASQLGCGPALEAVALRRALQLRSQLPANCFLSVNITPDYLGEPEVADVFADAGDLAGVVVELTEHRVLDDEVAVLVALARLRDAGALVAIDDAGAGYAGLRWLMTLRPDIVKLDRSLVADIDRDETRVALVEMLGSFSGRIDAWLLAEGIERQGELDALVRLGVPLAQGYLLARPDPVWPVLADGLGHHIRQRASAAADDVVAPLVETVPVFGRHHVAALESSRGAGELTVVVDRHGRPVGLRGGATAPTGRDRGEPMRVKATERTVDVLQRAVARPERHRWEPLVCVDARGRHLGIVRLERLLGALADHHRKDNP
jgi:EAL domain-containing protein (putative c-di-GMP-specific phosphodiesterase class I)